MAWKYFAIFMPRIPHFQVSFVAYFTVRPRDTKTKPLEETGSRSRKVGNSLCNFLLFFSQVYCQTVKDFLILNFSPWHNPGGCTSVGRLEKLWEYWRCGVSAGCLATSLSQKSQTNPLNEEYVKIYAACMKTHQRVNCFHDRLICRLFSWLINYLFGKQSQRPRAHGDVIKCLLS